MMMKKKAIGIRALVQGDTLAGRLAGQALRPMLEEQLRGAADSLLVLDFRGVELVTSSYFVGAFAWLWTSFDLVDRDIFPVLANLGEDSLDDVELALREMRLKTLVGAFSEEGLGDVRPLNLDQVEAETYYLVERLGEAGAGDLFRLDTRIQVTAWNNRLAALFNYRLLRRRKDRRQFLYSVAWR
jgi:hypothetical protein